MFGAAAMMQLADQPALGAGLLGDEHIAQHGLGLLVDVLRGLAQLDAALEAALESAFAAAAGVNLRLDGNEIGALGQAVARRCSWPPPACRKPRQAAWRRRIGPAIVWPGIRECSFRVLLTKGSGADECFAASPTSAL